MKKAKPGLRFNCYVCNRDIEDKTGAISVCYASIRKTEEGQRKHDEYLNSVSPPTPGGLQVFSAKDFLGGPEVPRTDWRSSHYECDEKHESCDYWFAVERCRSWPDLTEWSAHLIETKAWLRHTNWDWFLRKVIKGNRTTSGDIVYLVQAGDSGPIKIGHTLAERLDQRLGELQTGSPQRLRLLATLPGGKSREAELHRKFQSNRISGEWFKPTPELLALAGGAH